ncbi:hypothetical protein [Kangiella sp.]|uniref:hypothetical protein n=1 Tax=Kangiella sp. TaxID=1920245 RepID=UPI0019A1A7DB|nr:hypothetical protein [Kangiella sp.]MBD3653148.1 hypothetical protein [Kangiella sp.]
MRLDNEGLYNLFKRKGVQNLFHASTVATSITFIEQGGLLSRQDVEDGGLYQTPQTSDDIDKLFDVFGDVFLDTTDLHKYFSRQNHYGPVLFIFNLELVLDTDLDIWVTKDNPINWDRHSDLTTNYFQSVDELSEQWGSYQIQRKMITVRKPARPILFKHLIGIILDNPKVLINENISLSKESRTALEKVIGGNDKLRKMLGWRECGHCFCQDNYLHEVRVPELVQKFLPTYHAEFEE